MSLARVSHLDIDKDFSWNIDQESHGVISSQDSLAFDETMINKEKGIFLSKSSNQKCELKLYFGEQTVKMKEIRFIGQSRHVELHINNQYIGTFKGKEIWTASGIFDVIMEFSSQLASTIEFKLSLGTKSQTTIYQVILHIEDVIPKNAIMPPVKPQIATMQEDNQSAMMSMLLSNFSSLRTAEPLVIPPEVRQYIPDISRRPTPQNNNQLPEPQHQQRDTAPVLTEADVQRIVHKAVADMEDRINAKIDQATMDIKKFIQDALSAKQS